MHNMRFHLIAISCIIALVTVIFSVTGQFKKNQQEKPPAPVIKVVDETGTVTEVEVEEEIGDRYITVWEASWGLNCNGRGRDDAPKTGFVGAGDEVQRNNVMGKVKELCNGKLSCEFKADYKTLGRPTQDRRCRPQFEMIYRCFSFDRPWTVSARSGDVITIDCKE